MSETKANGTSRTDPARKRAGTEVEYIRINDRQVVIKTTRPGERPVETIAAVFPSRNGHTES